MGLYIYQVKKILQEVEFDLVFKNVADLAGVVWEIYSIVDPKQENLVVAILKHTEGQNLGTQNFIHPNAEGLEEVVEFSKAQLSAFTKIVAANNL